MKKYDFKYVEENVDKRFFGLNDCGKTFEIQRELKGLHNQNRIVIDYFKSSYYINNNKYDEYWNQYKELEEDKKREFQEELYWRVTYEYRKLDEITSKIKPEELIFSDVEPYIKLLAHHLDANLAAYSYQYRKDTPYFARFGILRLINGLDEKEIKYVLKNAAELTDLMESHHVFNEQRGLDWNAFLRVCWILFEGGLAEVSLYISSILENLLNIPMGKYTPALNNTFKAIDKSNYVRNWSTTLWIKIMSLLQLERKQEAIFYLKKLINLFIYAPYPQSYVLNNRVVEAAVLLNKLEPSEETTLTAKKLFILNSSRFLYDHTEATRERGLIIYDFCKYVLNENI